MLTQEAKQEIMQKYAVHEGDTGSPEVQIAVLTARIQYLTDHLKSWPAEDGWSSPPSPQLPLQEGHRALSFHHR